MIGRETEGVSVGTGTLGVAVETVASLVVVGGGVALVGDLNNLEKNPEKTPELFDSF